MILLIILSIVIPTISILSGIFILKEIENIRNELRTEILMLKRKSNCLIDSDRDIKERIEKIIDTNLDIFEIFNKITFDDEFLKREDLEELKKYIEKENGRLHMKIAFTPLKIVREE